MRVDDHIAPMLMAAAVFHPLGAAALTLSQCDQALPPLGYASETRTTDIGGGLVRHLSENRVNGDETRFVVLTDCASGRQISAMSACAQVTAGFCGTGKRAMDAPDKVAEKLNTMIEASERYSLDQVRHGLDGVALEIRDTTLSHEICGCRAAYPRLRNGKTRFKMEPLN